MTHQELRETFKKFWESKGHIHVPPAPLVLQNDPTTLFTSSGMQPLVPYLSGQSHPLGKRLYNIQPCYRAVDIDEVGNNRHTTFFEMMGNWSLGDYFKQEQLSWCWEFFTQELGLPQERLHVTVFEGGAGVSKDEETPAIWKKLGVPDSRIHFYATDKNWWSRAGTPEQMPAGEIGGPDSEVFYEFDTRHDTKFGEKCHPNCDCGRFLEIGNSVFIQYRKKSDGSLEELSQKNVDYGGSIERILMAVNNESDIFRTDLFDSVIHTVESVSGKSYSDSESQSDIRIIADHLKGATMMLAEGVKPSNKMQGYVVRRLLRRVAVKLYDLEQTVKVDDIAAISLKILEVYDGITLDKHTVKEYVVNEIKQELTQFSQTLDRGIREFNKRVDLNEKTAFDLYQSYGFPFEITAELAGQKGITLNKQLFEQQFEEHKQTSRTSSAGMFKGGLADHSDQVIKYHTATHLLHQALRDVLGDTVRQEGSNITGERLRFDFSFDRKPTDEEVKKVEAIINQKIQEGLPVERKIMKRQEAEKLGALSFFKEKYGEEVSVYSIATYSKEFCGGPHVQNTSEIGMIQITKIEKIGANLLRVYAQ